MRIDSLLFVPGNDREKIDKAFSSAATAICLDLEDAVAEDHKDAARTLACEALEANSDSQPKRMVRINPATTAAFQADIQAAVAASVDAILIPMAETETHLTDAVSAIASYEDEHHEGRTRVIPIIESAMGVLNVLDVIRASERVEHVLFGPADFALSMGTTLSNDETEVLHGRQHVVLAARAVGILAIDGPFIFLQDDEGFRRSARTGARLGYSGKALIHPRQIEACIDIFRIAEEEIIWARRVSEAFSRAEKTGVSSIQLDDGTFVDYAIAKRARQILDTQLAFESGD